MFAPDFQKIKELYRENEQAFLSFAALLSRYNARYNLTSITSEEEVLYKHFYDSLAGEGLFLQNSSVIEVGSGAGFPSLPLKIVRRDLKFTLVESTGKKCDFLRAAVKELNLENVTVINSRAEDLGKSPLYREQFDCCCARAVARLNTLVEYCMPLVKVGGRVIAYKGADNGEIAQAERAIALFGGKKQVVSYELPEGYGARTLVHVDKISPTPPRYPRGNGKERSNPVL